MPQAALQPTIQSTSVPLPAGTALTQPFAGQIDAILVPDPAPFSFPGAVACSHAEAVWHWIVRDVCPDLLPGALELAPQGAALELLLDAIAARVRSTLALATEGDARYRLRAQIGSDGARDAAPVLLRALRYKGLLGKAQAFGKAANTIADDGALATALQSMPLQDPALSALLFQAAVGQVAQPKRLITSVIKLAGGATEAAITRLGFGPLLDAVLAHAQAQLHLLEPRGAFADIDLTCRGLERFHRCVRAVAAYVELSRNGRWTGILASLTREASERMEPRLRDVPLDINRALRRPREGADRVDADEVLAAINGMYLLAAVRDCRDSLGVSALFDQAWSQSGQTLEQHVQRGLDAVRADPGDRFAGLRLDAGIKMAEIRFNTDYADTLRRARATAERRA